MTKNWLDQTKKAISRTFDLPPNVLTEIPKITIVGKMHIYIENHKGILSFTANELYLQLNSGALIVSGKNFVLKKFFIDEIMLEGLIEKVEFVENVNKHNN